MFFAFLPYWSDWGVLGTSIFLLYRAVVIWTPKKTKKNWKKSYRRNKVAFLIWFTEFLGKISIPSFEYITEVLSSDQEVVHSKLEEKDLQKLAEAKGLPLTPTTKFTKGNLTFLFGVSSKRNDDTTIVCVRYTKLHLLKGILHRVITFMPDDSINISVGGTIYHQCPDELYDELDQVIETVRKISKLSDL